MKIILIFNLLFLFVIKNLYADPLVTIDWLAKNTCKRSVKILEVGKSFNSYQVEHIACSHYTNFYNDKWRVKKNETPFLLPSPEQLKALVESFGIKETDTIILYVKKNDKYAMAETTSIFFTFKYIGHKKISILNGSFDEFKKSYPFKVDDEIVPVIEKSYYNLILNDNILADYEDIKEQIKLKRALVDSRETDFFYGINKIIGFEKYGTIKGSKNIPAMWNLEGRNLKFNNKAKLQKIFAMQNIDGNKDQPIFFCNAGLESSINWFVSNQILKHNNSRLYEPSLYEWVNKEKDLFIK